MAAAYPDRGAGNDPEPLGFSSHFTTKALHSLMHLVKLLQTWLIETEGNMGVMICFYQGGLSSPIASSSLF